MTLPNGCLMRSRMMTCAMTKHIINKNPKQQQEFLESVYEDLRKCRRDGYNQAKIELTATLNVAVIDDNGAVQTEERIAIEIGLTNIDALGVNMAETLGSMLGSLLNENNIGEFDYECKALE